MEPKHLINFLPENVIRACEIAIVGGHTIHFLRNTASLLLTPEQFENDVEFIKFAFHSLDERLGSKLAYLVQDELSAINVKYIPKRSREYLWTGVPVLDRNASYIKTYTYHGLDFDSPRSIENTTSCAALLSNAEEKLNLSTSQILHIYKVAHTIARLDESTIVKVEHLAEAIQYQCL